MTTALRVHDLLRRVCADGLRLHVEGDKLIVRGAAAVRARWRPALVQAKVEIIAALAVPAANDTSPQPSARWLIHFTDRDPVEVTFDPPVDHDQALAYPGAIAAAPLLEPVSPEPGCSGCQHVSAFGNCAAPSQAGLADRFMLVKHPDGGRGCRAFAHKVTAIEHRLRKLLMLGAIDADDAQLCRRRYQDDPAAWDCLLDACEAAAKGDGHDETH